MQQVFFLKLLNQAINIALLFWLLWALITLGVFAFRWISSIIIPSNNEPIAIDLRINKNQHGKKITLCAVKANPSKAIYFGHIWVVWPENDGIQEAGFYAKNRFIAFLEIMGAIIAPFCIFFKQHPIEGVMLDDSGLYRDWQIEIEIDFDTYLKAREIDAMWRNEQRYCLRPSLNGKTYNCRDYALEIAQVIGLKAIKINWWEFPSELFEKLMLANEIKFETKKLFNFRQKELVLQS